jgi:ubiquitin C-terminal hydrolase
VTGEQVAELLELFHKLDILAPPYLAQQVSIHDQQDASEILQALLSMLGAGEELQVQTTRVTLAKGKEPSVARESHPILHLDVGEKTSSIDDAIRLYCAEHGVGESATSRLTFSRLPKVLTISLKRFRLLYGVWPSKILRDIDAPENLKFPGECLADDFKGKALYHLTTIGHHEGIGGHEGHYTAYVRDSQGRWVRNDDIGGRSRPSPQDMENARKTGYLYIYELDT